MIRHAFFVLLLLSFGCGDDDASVDSGPDISFDAGPSQDLSVDADEADVGTDMGTDATLDMGQDEGADMGAGTCGEGPACTSDQSFQLSFVDRITAGEVTNRPAEDGSGFISTVDASAGGFPPSEGSVYVRFTDEGLERVEITDDASFTSTEWDMAMRRFVIRLNGGVAGPSCVEGGFTPLGTDFDALTELTDDVVLRQEDYYTEDCTFVPDLSGIGSPQTVLSSYWQFAMCVQMTGEVFVIALPDGRLVKLRVDTYYTDEQQAACNETGMLLDGPTGSGSLTLRWAFLE